MSIKFSCYIHKTAWIWSTSSTCINIRWSRQDSRSLSLSIFSLTRSPKILYICITFTQQQQRKRKTGVYVVSEKFSLARSNCFSLSAASNTTALILPATTMSIVVYYFIYVYRRKKMKKKEMVGRQQINTRKIVSRLHHSPSLTYSYVVSLSQPIPFCLIHSPFNLEVDFNWIFI